MTVGLVMIAKNEAHVIARAIESARPLVDVMTVVVDDATTDDTVAVCEKLGARTYVRPYRGSLAEARNEAIDLAKNATDYLLMLDPDDTVEGFLPEPLMADVYDVMIHDGPMRHARPQLFRSAAVQYWRPRHEELRVSAEATRALAPDLVYRRMGGGYLDTLGQRDKHLANVRDLTPWILNHHPEDAGGVFVLAQSYRDAGEVEAARGWYEVRLGMQEQGEHAFLAALEIAFLVEKYGETEACEVMAAYLRAHERDPMRAEPLFHLSCYLRSAGHAATAWHFAQRAATLEIPTGRTILDVELYEWKATAELAMCAQELGDKATADELLESIMIELAGQPAALWAERQMRAVVVPEPRRTWTVSKPLKILTLP